jgi:hypothetical protein
MPARVGELMLSRNRARLAEYVCRVRSVSSCLLAGIGETPRPTEPVVHRLSLWITVQWNLRKPLVFLCLVPPARFELALPA